VDVANDLKLKSRQRQLEQYKQNIDDGIGYMQTTDTAMTGMNDLMQRVRELALQGASDTMSINERQFLNREVEQVLRQIITLANTSFKGDYIFAGVQTKIVPFPVNSSKASVPENYTNLEMAYYDATATANGSPVQIRNAFTGDPITNIIPGTFNLSVAGTKYFEGTDYTIDYAAGTITIIPTGPNAAILKQNVLAGANYTINGFKITFDYIGQGKDIYGSPINNNGQILREVDNGIVVPINVTADELLVDNKTGTNLFKSIIGLGQNLIQSNTAGIQNSITKLDFSFKNLLSAQAMNGARVNRFEVNTERNESQQTETTRLQSELEDADLAEAATNYSVAQTVYEAALKSAAKIIQPSLADFL
jgi:flagellar hook-associated protein 3 FlgL